MYMSGKYMESIDKCVYIYIYVNICIHLCWRLLDLCSYGIDLLNLSMYCQHGI